MAWGWGEGGFVRKWQYPQEVREELAEEAGSVVQTEAVGVPRLL